MNWSSSDLQYAFSSALSSDGGTLPVPQSSGFISGLLLPIIWPNMASWWLDRELPRKKTSDVSKAILPVGHKIKAPPCLALTVNTWSLGTAFTRLKTWVCSLWSSHYLNYRWIVLCSQTSWGFAKATRVPHSEFSYFLHVVYEFSALSSSFLWVRLEAPALLLKISPLVIGQPQENSRVSCWEMSQLRAWQASYSFRFLRDSHIEEFWPAIVARVLCKTLICEHSDVYLFNMVDISYVNKGFVDEALFWYYFGTMWVREVKAEAKDWHVIYPSWFLEKQPGIIIFKHLLAFAVVSLKLLAVYVVLRDMV